MNIKIILIVLIFSLKHTVAFAHLMETLTIIKISFWKIVYDFFKFYLNILVSFKKKNFIHRHRDTLFNSL